MCVRLLASRVRFILRFRWSFYFRKTADAACHFDIAFYLVFGGWTCRGLRMLNMVILLIESVWLTIGNEIELKFFFLFSIANVFFIGVCGN
jgi:hypothetical protein